MAIPGTLGIEKSQLDSQSFMGKNPSSCDSGHFYLGSLGNMTKNLSISISCCVAQRVKASKVTMAISSACVTEKT
jgi:hypothetical protein